MDLLDQQEDFLRVSSSAKRGSAARRTDASSIAAPSQRFIRSEVSNPAVPLIYSAVSSVLVIGALCCSLCCCWGPPFVRGAAAARTLSNIGWEGGGLPLFPVPMPPEDFGGTHFYRDGPESTWLGESC